MMLAMLRVNRTRSPFAETSISSPMALPLKSSASVPPWPSTVSLPSPGSHWKRSLPAAELGAVEALVAVEVVVAAAAEQEVGAVAAAEVVVAAAAVDGDLRSARRGCRSAVSEVGAAEAADDEALAAVLSMPAVPVDVGADLGAVGDDRRSGRRPGAGVGRRVGALAAVDVRDRAGRACRCRRGSCRRRRGRAAVTLVLRLAAEHARLGGEAVDGDRRRRARRSRRCPRRRCPLAITASAWPSPPPPNAARSTSASSDSVPVRSSTVTVSAPPSARTAMRSMPSRSMTMLAMLRVKRTRVAVGRERP